MSLFELIQIGCLVRMKSFPKVTKSNGSQLGLVPHPIWGISSWHLHQVIQHFRVCNVKPIAIRHSMVVMAARIMPA